jgi:hypothetical protein
MVAMDFLEAARLGSRRLSEKRVERLATEVA